MLHDVMGCPILKVPSEEPNVSSKYDLEDGGVL